MNIKFKKAFKEEMEEHDERTEEESVEQLIGINPKYCKQI